MYYYQHHIGDFIRDTARLSDAQAMAYLRLLWIYYDTEKPLSDDHEKLAFQIGANSSDVRQILDHYFTLDANALRTHDRCDKEIAHFHSKSEKASNSANARWNNANALRTQSERNANEPKTDANQEPITNNQDKTKSLGAAHLVSLGVNEQYAKDWIAVRKAKKAPITQTVISGLQNEAKKAGLTLADVIEICAKKSWQSFKASWEYKDVLDDSSKPFDMNSFFRKVGAIPE